MRLAIAGGMAFLAGATDVHGLTILHDLFVSFMSGNSTMLGLAIGHGDFARAGRIALVLLLFVGGAGIGTVIALATATYHTVAVSLATTLLLLIPLGLPQFGVGPLVLAMGVLNAAMHRAGSIGVSLTYVTGALVKVGQGIGAWLCGHRDDRSWPVQALLWSSLMLGAISCATIEYHGVADVALLLPVLAAFLALAAIVERVRAGPNQA